MSHVLYRRESDQLDESMIDELGHQPAPEGSDWWIAPTEQKIDLLESLGLITVLNWDYELGDSYGCVVGDSDGDRPDQCELGDCLTEPEDLVDHPQRGELWLCSDHAAEAQHLGAKVIDA